MHIPGLASRWLSGRVRHVYLGLPEAARLLKFGKRTQVFDTGNPITPPAPQRRPAAMEKFGLDGTRPVVLVTGGSQGALAINRAVAGWLDAGERRPDATLIWVTGRGSHEEFARYHRPPDVHVIDFLDPMADGYAVADLVVSRAGHDHRGRVVCLGHTKHPDPAAHRGGRPSDPQCAGAGVSRSLATATCNRS